jgi:hypothetical protein
MGLWDPECAQVSRNKEKVESTKLLPFYEVFMNNYPVTMIYYKQIGISILKCDKCHKPYTSLKLQHHSAVPSLKYADSLYADFLTCLVQLFL